MSQSNVERVIGVLVTDEALRRRFVSDPQSTLQRIAESGMELTVSERRALASIDQVQLEHFAEGIDARLQKIDAGGSWF